MFRKKNLLRKFELDAYELSILFVCKANICRSPIFESIAKRFLIAKGLRGVIRVGSAGVSTPEFPARPSLRLRLASLKRRYSIKPFRNQLSRLHLRKYDLVVSADRECFYSFNAFDSNPTAKICLLSDFLDDSWPIDVPDPMNRSLRTCNRVLDMGEAAIPAIIAFALRLCDAKANESGASPLIQKNANQVLAEPAALFIQSPANAPG